MDDNSSISSMSVDSMSIEDDLQLTVPITQYIQLEQFEEEDERMRLELLTIYLFWKQQHPPIEHRCVRVIYSRLIWNDYWQQYLHDPKFERMIRMKRPSFVKLVGYLRNDLLVDEDMADLRGGPVTPELCVHLTLRYLASGSMDDVEVFISISKSTFYRCLHKTLCAINSCRLLDIVFPSDTNDCIKLARGFSEVTRDGICNCVGVVDGFLLSIDKPSIIDTRNQNSYFSGHYQRMGMNIQACCDSNCIFTYFAVTGPGSMNDRAAACERLPGEGSFINKTESLPGQYVIIADAAYDATEKLVPMFYGAQRRCPRNDNFNYVASRARIHIEIAFGRMTNKWGILHRPLRQRLPNVSLIALSIARLHNFCAKERLISSEFGDDQNYDSSPHGNNVPFLTSTPNRYREGCEFPVAPENQPRLFEDLQITRPIHSPIYRAALNENIIF